MLKAISRALARALELLGSGIEYAGSILRTPFDWLFGGRAMPHYDEGEQPDARLSRLFTDVPKPDTDRVARADAYTQVRDYLRKPHLRGTVDLSSVRQEVLDVLMSMSPAECEALVRAGDSKIRLFADGQDPQVFGVPHAGMKTAPVALEVPVVESLQERIQRKMKSVQFEVPKVA